MANLSHTPYAAIRPPSLTMPAVAGAVAAGVLLAATAAVAAGNTKATPLLAAADPSGFWVGCVAFLLLLAYLGWHYLQYGDNKGKGGPTIYPFVGALPDIFAHYPYLYDHAAEVLEKSPTMTYRSALLGENEIITANPDNLQHILKDNFANYPKGPQFQASFGDLLGHGIFNSDGEVWRQQRKTASLEFSTRSLRDLTLKAVQQEVQHRLLPTLAKAAETGRAVDVQDMLLRYTFDNICRVGFGVDPGCLAPDFPDIPFARAFDVATKATMMRNIMPQPVWRFLKWLNIAHESRLSTAVEQVTEFTNKVIAKRKQELAEKAKRVANGKAADGVSRGKASELQEEDDDEHTDILSRMMALGAKDGGQLYSDSFLRDACTNFILAGRDTSSVALSWLFWLLTWHPDVEKKIVREIDDIIAARGPDVSPDEPFSFEELRSMHYTHAAINESLRLYPSVPADSKYVLEDDVLPDGTRVRKGWRVMYAIYAMGRMTRVWGPDAATFRPERWIDESGGVKVESPFKFPAFNAGPRLCLGRDMAYMQMKSVTANLLRRYRLRLVPGHKVEYAMSLTLFMRHGLLMTVHLRPTASAAP